MTYNEDRAAYKDQLTSHSLKIVGKLLFKTAQAYELRKAREQNPAAHLIQPKWKQLPSESREYWMTLAEAVLGWDNVRDTVTFKFDILKGPHIPDPLPPGEYEVMITEGNSRADFTAVPSSSQGPSKMAKELQREIKVASVLSARATAIANLKAIVDLFPKLDPAHDRLVMTAENIETIKKLATTTAQLLSSVQLDTSTLEAQTRNLSQELKADKD